VIELSLNGAGVAFSTRAGGVSEGTYESLNLGILTDDVAERVRENRTRLVKALGLRRDRVAMGWQVHGTDLQEWAGPPDPRDELERVDGHLTREPGLALLVLVADCLPVALAGGDQVAMVHCGWRGLAGGILDKAVRRFDETPSAAIGPGIGACCYEVGEEVLAAFADVDGASRGRMLDLRRVARTHLEAAGVTEIEDVDLCTSCREDLFFSHRRDHGVTGRQGGLVWRT
jgi:purine-nucleoside/S-methyl-5'-thioadenosine phosphorylase / adenosine deaminase